MTDAFIYDAVRTPRGKGRPDGALHEVTSVALSAGLLNAVKARNGLEGIELQGRERPDLILTDLFMPKMGGDEMTAALRGSGVCVPIIGMTAAAIGDERTTFENAGTDFVLTKPVSTAQLVEALGRLRQPAA